MLNHFWYAWHVQLCLRVLYIIGAVSIIGSNYISSSHRCSSTEIATQQGFIRVSTAEMRNRHNTVLLFDVDGTLTAPMKVIEPEMEEFLLTTVKPKCTIGLVGGSDLKKITHQMGGDKCLQNYDYVFAENGLIAFKNGSLVGKESIQSHMGEEKLQLFINYALRYMSELTLPVKRGTFIEFRTGLINVCPVGRSCTQQEREEFFEYDKVHKIREKFVKALEKQFPDLGLIYSIGGQISIDVFPVGWDKTFCLKYLEQDGFNEIHFFGDKTDPGGNDHHIFVDPRTKGHKVLSPADTRKQLEELLLV